MPIWIEGATFSAINKDHKFETCLDAVSNAQPKPGNLNQGWYESQNLLLCEVPTIYIGKRFALFFYPHLHIKYKWSAYSRHLF